ncbi:MAG: Protein fmp52, mitochondrial [Thelocarpon impressellum]|nr:MAG: Protein fmp52, mitochondrial [Thelocarpon impressellum]
MTTASLIGSTGLVGTQILSVLLQHPAITKVTTLSRRAPKPAASGPTDKLEALTSADSVGWPAQLASVSPTPDIYVSALGTTRGQAGSLAAQRAIDHDLNLALAKAAKDAGAKVCVLISTAGCSKSSPIPYNRMKGEIEEAVVALGFEHTVLIKPGLLLGNREDSRPAEAVFRSVANCLKTVGGGALTDWWAQDSAVIAKAAVSAALRSLEGKAPEGAAKVWRVEQSDIIKLGRREWEEPT